MMKDYGNTYEMYTPLPEHTITEFSQDPRGQYDAPYEGNRVVVQHLTTGEMRTIEISFCAILIGFRPDLRFLSPVIKPLAKHDRRKYSGHYHCDTIDEIIRMNATQADEALSGDSHQYTPQQQHHWSLLTKKIAWLKNLCAKCKHLNLCEWSRRNDHYRKPSNQSNFSRNEKCLCNNNLNISNSAVRNNNNIDNVCNQNTINNHMKFDAQVKLIHANQNNDNFAGIGFGEDPSKPIDCKTNPIAVDKFSNEVLRAPKGLFSMGPLVGDNFIRFIPGGALAITSSLHKEND